jgi:glycosyltransferase involved in cell wall biosynthesis
MKMLYVGRRIEVIVTGGERRISEVIGYLVKKGVEIEFLQVDASPSNLIKQNFLLTNLWYIWRFLKIDGTSKRIILEDYSHRLSLFIFNLFVRMARGKRTKLVSLVNGFYFSYRKSKIKNLIDRLVSILFFYLMDLVIAGGVAARKELVNLKVSNSRIRVVEPALRVEFSKYRKSVNDRRNNSIIKLLFVGRVDRIKGLEYLIRGVRLLNLQNVKLFIVGDTDRDPRYTNRLRQLVAREGLQENVVFLGEIKEVGKLIQLYKDAGIFVLPSLWDTYPASLLEAMCVGLPVVATDTGGIRQLTGHGNALLVPPKDERELASAIKKLVSDDVFLDQMGENSYRASLKFRKRTWEDVGKDYYGIFKELVENSKR